MSHSGRQIGDCKHGWELHRCPECGEPAYRVRALVWSPWVNGIEFSDTMLGRLIVTSETWMLDRSVISGKCESIAHGKQLAEAWYRERLISEALEVVT